MHALSKFARWLTFCLLYNFVGWGGFWLLFAAYTAKDPGWSGVLRFFPDNFGLVLGSMAFGTVVSLGHGRVWGVGAGDGDSDDDRRRAANRSNPASGLPMRHGIDSAGNPWGTRRD